MHIPLAVVLSDQGHDGSPLSHISSFFPHIPMTPTRFAPAIAVSICLLLHLLSTLPAATPPPSNPLPDDEESLRLAWRFPAIRGVYRNLFRWTVEARAEDGLTTETLASIQAAAGSPLRPETMAAWLAVNDRATTPLLTRETYDVMRAAALDRFQIRSMKWESQPLLNAFLNTRLVPVASNAFAEYLLDQFSEDDVPNNAFASAEIYLVGLQEDPAAFVPPLCERWRKIAARESRWYDQEATMVLNLVLLYASDPHDVFSARRESWYHLSKAQHFDTTREWTAPLLMPRDLVLDAAALLVADERSWWSPYELDGCEAGNKRMAWRILETAVPLPTEQLRRITLATTWSHRAGRHALLIWMLRDPQSLTTYRNRDSLIEVVAASSESCYRYYMQPVASLIADGDFHESDWSELDWYFQVPVLWLCPESPRRRMAPYRDEYRRILRDALDLENQPWRQLNLAWVLAHANDIESAEQIAIACVSNLTDDDVFGNAEDADSLLYQFPEMGAEVARAGICAGAKNRDWQMVNRCLQFLHDYDEEFRLTEFPDVMRFVADQLRDDEIRLNADSAKRYLWYQRHDAADFLRTLLDSDDEQQRTFAAEILGLPL